MIRPIEAKDLPRLEELAQWEFGPDYMTGLVLVDASGTPIAFAGAWQLAEVHMAIDKEWATPGARYMALKQLHDAMELELHRLHVTQAVTWLEGMRALGRRLKGLGWVKSELNSWHRGIR